MNIILDDDIYICRPKVIKFARVGWPFSKTVLMVDGDIIKTYYSEEQIKRDKKNINFYFGLAEPTLMLKRESEEYYKV